MENVFDTVIGVFQGFQHNIPVILGFLAVMWVAFLLSLLTQFRLNILGIYPRKIWGLPGIFFYTFLHGSFSHLFFNSVILFVLAGFVSLNGLLPFMIITVTIILLSGILVWLFARPCFHIGASCLLMGYFSYLLIDAYENPALISVIIAFVTIFYFGGLFFALLSFEQDVSWEGHIFGFIAGIITYFGYPYITTSPTVLSFIEWFI